jgi:hypothetical protein
VIGAGGAGVIGAGGPGVIGAGGVTGFGLTTSLNLILASMFCPLALMVTSAV